MWLRSRCGLHSTAARLGQAVGHLVANPRTTQRPAACPPPPHLHEAGGVEVIGETTQCVAAQLLVLVRLQRERDGSKGPVIRDAAPACQCGRQAGWCLPYGSRLSPPSAPDWQAASRASSPSKPSASGRALSLGGPQAALSEPGGERGVGTGAHLGGHKGEVLCGDDLVGVDVLQQSRAESKARYEPAN